jgi:hypothetical protein
MAQLAGAVVSLLMDIDSFLGCVLIRRIRPRMDARDFGSGPHTPDLGSRAVIDHGSPLGVIVSTRPVVIASPLGSGGALSWRCEGVAEGRQGLLDDAVVGPLSSLFAGE